MLMDTLKWASLRRQTRVQVRQACEHTGFFAVTHHGCPPAALTATFAAAQPLFDLPAAAKHRLAVRGMRAGRGYEVSPEHDGYAAAVAAARRRSPALDATLRSHPEPSTREGIMSERFMCGPPQPPVGAGGGEEERELREVCGC